MSVQDKAKVAHLTGKDAALMLEALDFNPFCYFSFQKILGSSTH